ncbi:putative O-glycosylation ligase, exosortase A system-associated [Novosphingobium sp. FSY-8]|uniref:O-glycosylation ligase, exosortase A system-associated n=1 Tax=Novosphingobium ovatum TaxID=1908523 RepID=A0ABW9XGM2_9SPHN|nr:putative O-glycosylation ligase, exosortase A system-associated [Novosphingobium ovatum]NBC37628.1 putative O-glycosylation ligase, exosortase A system-associated [Novosphingobium ovatum]
MRDLFLAGFLAFFLAMGLRRPFLWVLAYLYIDIVAPQKIAFGFLTSIPVSLIVFVMAVVGWLFFDNKEGTRLSLRQGLILTLLVYCFATTMNAAFPTYAAAKWDWVWKSLVFAAFLPLTLRTHLRLESAALVMVLSAAAIIINGAIKTLAGGGGYGTLKFLVNDNTGLYEGSTLACVAIAIIPLVLWLSKYGTIIPASKQTRMFAYALVFSALLIPVGTEARTGLLCMGLLAVLMLRSVKYRFVYVGLIGLGAFLATTVLPNSFSNRMNTIQNNQSDQSASTRLAVWGWTIGYAAENPFGGGFDSYRGNRLLITTTDADNSGNTVVVRKDKVEDNGRAFHSAYFEMLGEQGWPGLLLWLTLQLTGILQLEGVQRRLRRSEHPSDKRDAALALALQQGHFIYLLGAAFVGIAYQPFVYMLIGLQIGLVQIVRRRNAAQDAPGGGRRMVVPGAVSPVQPPAGGHGVTPMGMA